MSKVATSSYEYNPIQEWEEFLGVVDMHYHYGIHGDFKSWKLCTCLYGEIYVVIVDNRKDSKTYLQWMKFLTY